MLDTVEEEGEDGPEAQWGKCYHYPLMFELKASLIDRKGENR